MTVASVRECATLGVPMRRFFLGIAFSLSIGGLACAEDMGSVRLADGFDTPVGKDATKQYYKARGYRPNGHLGEDWNGAGGGDTDLGDPVYATAHGLVTFAQDYRLGWGNVVILRHAYMEAGAIKYVDSLYGHLNEIKVAQGQQVVRGQLIGTIGNNRGMYDAHLHFEMRKDLRVGMFRSSFPRDFSVYYDPTQFVAAHRQIEGGGKLVSVPINTYPETAPPILAGGSPLSSPATPGSIRPTTPAPSPIRRAPFRADRFQDLREMGY